MLFKEPRLVLRIFDPITYAIFIHIFIGINDTFFGFIDSSSLDIYQDNFLSYINGEGESTW